jgi:hypothetical protein
LEASGGETALVISGGVDAVRALLKGDYVAAANFIVGAGVAAKILSKETGFLIAGGAGAVAAFLKGDYAAAADLIIAAGVNVHVISWEAGSSAFSPLVAQPRAVSGRARRGRARGQVGWRYRMRGSQATVWIALVRKLAS